MDDFDDAFGDHDEIPPLQRPEDMPPVRSQADLHRTWRALMGELGFGSTLLWLMFIDSDDRCAGMLTQIEDLPARPDRELLDALMEVCARILEDGGGRVAFLRSRPGSRLVTADDRAWGAGLTTAASRTGVACAPVHLATDEAVLLLAADDLGDLGDLDLPNSA